MCMEVYVGAPLIEADWWVANEDGSCIDGGMWSLMKGLMLKHFVSQNPNPEYIISVTKKKLS